ncbi:bifunctional diguanylate cyclase/phosphodiesterase [Pseudomonas kilonensis]|uniref:bifunctional diguanylate cyclase/phosphodiesterase n=1 Tax=Pseudomonas kilonensis TaxID=132476 RepID=UPI0020A1CE02
MEDLESIHLACCYEKSRPSSQFFSTQVFPDRLTYEESRYALNWFCRDFIMQWPSHSLAVRLTAGIASIILFVYALAGLALYQSKHQHELQAVTTTENLARSLAINVSGVLDKVDVGLFAITSEVERQMAAGGINGALLNGFLTQQQAQIRDCEGLWVADEKGDVPWGTIMTAGKITNITDREYFQRLHENSHLGMVVSKPVIGRSTKTWSVLLSRRINNADGSFAGVALGSLRMMEYFSNMFSTIEIGKHGVIAIRDDEMALIVRYPTVANESGQVGARLVSAKATEATRSSPEAGSYTAVTPVDGIERLYTYRKIANYPLYIFVAKSTDDFLVPWRKEVDITLLLLAVFTLVILVFTRTSYRRETESRRAKKMELFRTAFRTSPDSQFITCLEDGRILEVNDGFTPVFGWTREDTTGKTVFDIDIWRYPEERHTSVRLLQQNEYFIDREAEFVSKDGRTWPGLVSAHVMTLDDTLCIQAIIRDISDRKAAEQQIQKLSFSDQLTGLPNRRLFMDRLEQALISSARHQWIGALMFVDLDDFKSINETLGHGQGDLFLNEIAQRLRRCVREGDTVARLGGDKFAFILENQSTHPQAAASHAENIGKKTLLEIWQPYQLCTSTLHRTCSIGITLFGEQNEDASEPLKRAELAMYQAKACGRNVLRFFDPKMQAIVSARITLEDGLREAIKQHRILLHYQPQVTDEGRITGVEALVRWKSLRDGMISPAEFIPLAEATGLIFPLGQQVLIMACQQLAVWAERSGFSHLTIAVNVSTRQFNQDDFVEQIRSVLNRSGANPHRLKLEITESMLVSNVEDVIAKMNALKSIGVGFSLDDFGTGYSSLSYLKRLPLDQLKIDQGFVRDILVDPNDAAIAKTVVALANSMNLSVIAEGVETRAQRDMLAVIGCHNYQGYLFGRPMDIDALEDYIEGGIDLVRLGRLGDRNK